MATITANVGSNNWNTNGAWAGGVQPTAADDVIIPSGAVVTIPSATTVQCRSWTVQSGGTLAGAATTSVLNTGDGTPGAGNVAINISSGATITNTAVWQINIATSSATQQTIATGGKTMPAINFGSVSGNSNILLSDALTAIGNLTLTRGTLDTGNFNVSTSGQFFGSGSNARTLTMGSSLIAASGATNAWNFSTITNLTITANTAIITVSGDRIIQNETLNWNGASFVMTGSGTIQSTGGTLTCKDFTRTGSALKTGTLQLGLNLTCTGAFAVNGNSSINRVAVISDIFGAPRTITAATVTASNVDFQDITGAGAGNWNLAAITGLSGDCGGNSGITFTTPATQTYAGGTGSWSDSSKWTSRVPLPQDNVIINTTTAGTLTGDMPRWGKDIDFTGFNKTFSPTVGAVTGSSNIYGSLTLDAAMTISSSTIQIGFGGRGSHTITMAGKTFTNTGVTFNQVGGTYTLQDDLISNGVGGNSAFNFNAGAFNANNKNLSFSRYNLNGSLTRVLTMGSGLWRILDTAAATVWNASVTNLTINPDTATIVIAAVSANTRAISLGGAVNYPTIDYTLSGSTGTLSFDNIAGAHIYDIKFSDASNARIMTFTQAQAVYFDAPHALTNVLGTSGKLMTVKSSTNGSLTTLRFPNGFGGGSDWLSVQDVQAVTNSWYAGANSTNVSNNSNVIFTAAPITFIPLSALFL